MRGYSRTPKFDKRKYPLRLVIERHVLIQEGIINIFGNRLECGHIVRPAKDLYGEIFSVRQRCKECFKELYG